MKLSLLIILLNPSLAFSQERTDSAKTEWEKYVREATIDKYIVIAGTSKNYNYLEGQANKISKKTGIPFENQMDYDEKLGMIVSDSLTDPMYYGSYFPRRYDDNRVSVEMLWYYQDSAAYDSSKEMIIITGIFEDKQAAQKQLDKVKAIVPTAYIKKKGIYMGCMH